MKHEPLAQVVLLLQGLIGQGLSSVVLLHKILDNCTSFPEHEISIGVLDCRDTAVRVEVSEGLLLHIFKLERVDFVWYVQLL